jgi:hypothetical protein
MKKTFLRHIEAEIEQQKRQLAQRTLQELSELPSRTDVQKEFEGQNYILTTWRDDLENGQVAIGIFADIPGVFGSTAIHDGFLVRQDGTRSPMPMDMQVKHI